MNRKVLNRPMFARMRNGSIKPVQYAQVGIFIQGGKYALPYLQPASKALTKIPGINYAKNYVIQLPAIIKKGLPDIYRKYIRGSNKKLNTPVSGAGQGDALGLASRTNLPAVQGSRELVPYVSKLNPYNLKNMINPALTMSSLVSLPYFTERMTETETETVLPGVSDEQRKRDREDKQRGMSKDDKKDVKNFDDMLKKGDLDSMIKDKIEIFEKYLGKDVDKRKKSAGYNAMIEFGLNLATARGGNLIDKISRSAKDPMAKFADVGRKILDRAEQIKMAGVEAGITASEKAADRDVERESIAADKEIQQMKNDATKMDKQQFMLEYSGKLLTDSDALKQVMRPYLDENGKLPEGTTPQMIVQATLENVWQSSQPKIITEELITLAQNTPGNEELSREEIIQGYIANGYSLK
tara:strand:- start:586 stop:1818 length:1233 start_codon:yes stop_codon:yes gene_type:complete